MDTRETTSEMWAMCIIQHFRGKKKKKKKENLFTSFLRKVSALFVPFRKNWCLFRIWLMNFNIKNLRIDFIHHFKCYVIGKESLPHTLSIYSRRYTFEQGGWTFFGCGHVLHSQPFWPFGHFVGTQWRWLILLKYRSRRASKEFEWEKTRFFHSIHIDKDFDMNILFALNWSRHWNLVHLLCASDFPIYI